MIPCRLPGRSPPPDEPRSKFSVQSNSVLARRRSNRKRSLPWRRACRTASRWPARSSNGARIPLSVKGDRLLDVIAAAGGAKSPVYETFVRLSRGGITATIPMERWCRTRPKTPTRKPDDVLTLVRLPQSFTAFGATGTNALIPFTAERMTLAEALAKAGGLQDQRSDPAGVFLFRYEQAPMVKSLGRPVLATGPDAQTPVVYRLDLRNAKSFFFAQRFPIEDKDVIYVANADLNELQKFFTLINTLTGPIISGVVVSNAVK